MKCIMSWQTMEVHLTIGAFVDLDKYTNSEEFKEKYLSATYIIPKRLNQDIVESFLSVSKGFLGMSRAYSAAVWLQLYKPDICKAGQMVILPRLCKKWRKQMTI